MRNVLAVGAHPDDIELGCGGALAAHAAAGDMTTMLILTSGQRGPAGRFGNTRRVEAENAARIVGAQLLWGGLDDCCIDAGPKTISVIEDALTLTMADVVYTHAVSDSHRDHRDTATATMSAARRRGTILHYQTPSTLRFDPTVFVDVDETMVAKLAALACHVSQVAGSDMVDVGAVAASCRHWGATARLTNAEAFEVTRFTWDITKQDLGCDFDLTAELEVDRCAGADDALHSAAASGTSFGGS